MRCGERMSVSVLPTNLADCGVLDLAEALWVRKVAAMSMVAATKPFASAVVTCRYFPLGQTALGCETAQNSLCKTNVIHVCCVVNVLLVARETFSFCEQSISPWGV